MYKYDLHIHTAEVSACSKLSGADMVKEYRKIGYSGIVITDHYFKPYFDSLGDMEWEDKVDSYMTGYKNALAAAKGTDFVVLFGIELSFYYHANDYLIFGVTREFLLKYPELFRSNIEYVSKIVHENGLLIFQAHPFRTDKMTRISTDLIDGMEIYNGHANFDPKKEITAEYIKKNNVKAISGSDCHSLLALGKGGIEVEKKILDDDDLLNLLRQCDGIKIIEK
jgi:predicted metal-dependent phosphoesterase TrpH